MHHSISLFLHGTEISFARRTRKELRFHVEFLRSRGPQRILKLYEHRLNNGLAMSAQLLNLDMILAPRSRVLPGTNQYPHTITTRSSSSPGASASWWLARGYVAGPTLPSCHNRGSIRRAGNLLVDHTHRSIGVAVTAPGPTPNQ